MSNDAHIAEQAAPAESGAPEAADPRIAVARMWLCMLGGLMEVATRFTRYLLHQIMPFGRGPKAPHLALRFSGDPITVYRRVVRISRFAAVLYLKIQKQIAAWKAGEPFDIDAFLAQTPAVKALSKRGRDAAGSDEDDAEEFEDFEDFEEFENLVEYEPFERFDVPDGSERPARQDKYEALLRGPLKDAIAAICKDLGLKPDWSLWTAQGFPPPPGGGVEDWVAFFVPKAVVPEAVVPEAVVPEAVVPETVAAPPPIPNWVKAFAPPCPEDEVRAAIWRRRWLPSPRRPRPPPWGPSLKR